MDNQKIIYSTAISKEEINLAGKDWIGRELTDIELNRLITAGDEIEAVRDTRCDLIRELVEGVTNDPEEWSGINENYLEKKKLNKKS